MVAGVAASSLRSFLPATGFGHARHTLSFAHLVLLGVYLVLCTRFFGLYPQNLNQAWLREQRLTMQATASAALLLCGTLYLLPGNAVPRAEVILPSLLSLAMLMIRRGAWRWIVERCYLRGIESRNVLIIGDGRLARALRHNLEEMPHMGFRFKGFIAPSSYRGRISNSEVVGDVDSCVAVARSLFVDEIYIAAPLDRSIAISLAEQAQPMGIDVRLVPELSNDPAWKSESQRIGKFPTISLTNRAFIPDAFLTKRLMDLALSCLVLLLFWPLLALIALVIAFDSRGSVLYRAERIGRDGRKFTCFKFRTMVVGADQRQAELAHLNERKGVLFKIPNDPRVSRVGAFLRKYSLDELPQLFNVLRGEMSLVGPRPPLAGEVEQYQLIHLRRLDVLPGMTGLWQVEARQDPSFDSYIALDTAYVENWNLLLDLRILARTAGVVLSGTGS
jgi:exopolysaccharide biosynthesis polyprenyl glycosylphosphotransferase